MAKRRGRRPALAAASIAVLERALANRRREVDRLQARRDRWAARLADVERALAAVRGGPGAGRPPAAAAARKVAPRRRYRGQTSLAEAISQVLKSAGAPMRLTAVADSVRAAGYKSGAKRFDKMVHKAINRLAAVRRVGRGMYVSKASGGVARRARRRLAPRLSVGRRSRPPRHRARPDG